MSDQISELQMMQMDHERSIESLSDQLHSQQSRIERLEKQLETLIDHIRSQQESPPATESGNNLPPHY